MSEISRCDNGACYNENLIEEQAIEIQKLKTTNNKLIESIGFAVYFMRESGYHCMDKIEPEFKMYKEFKDILDEIKNNAR